MTNIKQLIMTLVALLAVTTGAWAQTETLLTTITPTGDASYSETTTGVATVSLSNDNGWYSEDYGWCWYSSGSVTVEAKEGYTITKCVFKQNDKTPVTITTSPFAITFNNDDGHCEQNLIDYMNGVTSIEVYTASAASSGPEVAWDKATKTGTFKMPGGNVTLEPEYYPQATVADGGVTAADADARATTDDPLVKVDATKLTGAKELMYFVSNSGTTAPAYDAEGWTDQLPTAEGFTQQGIVYVWYYPVGIDEGVDGATATYSDGDICLQSITARIAAEPTYAVTFNAANANTIESGKATVTVGGTAATVTEGKLEGVKMGSEVKVKANTGYKFRKVEVKKKEGTTQQEI